VIVHELLHFSVTNHGKLWKSLMTAYLGDYEKIELKLKKISGNQQAYRNDSKQNDYDTETQ